MLTRFIRIQLAIFTIVGTFAVTMMIINYIQAPTLLGIGRITVTVELPAAGGLYRFSNVTYRGVRVGKVTAVALTRNGAKATLSLGTSPKIPANLTAEVRSISAVGEQFVDLQPRTDSPPYLRDGSVIPMSDTRIPQPVGPMLDQVSALVDSIPKNKLNALLDESFKGFNGAGYDLGSLVDSTATVSGDLTPLADRTRILVEDSGALLDSQAQTTDAIRTWARSLAGVTEQVVSDDDQLRTLLQKGPGALDEVSRLLDQVKPTLPVLLANLTTVGRIAVKYHAGLEQLLVLLPPDAASIQSYGLGRNNPYGFALGDFTLTVSDPPACTVGFLPPSSWRSPADTTTIDTPDGLYCKLPQDSPLGVRGARNYPCMGKPGKRAPTVDICDSDKPYEPLAMRQHALGPYPIDPNLLSQGIPPDDRVTFGDNIFGPVEGTALPPGAAPAGTPAGTPSPPASPPSPQSVAPPPPSPTAAPSPAAGPDGAVAPASARSSATRGPALGPSVAVAQYNPVTGQYATPDGQIFTQSDLVAPRTAQTWKDFFPT